MKYSISYSSLHDPKSLKRINQSDLSAIKRAVEEKLMIAPETFGKPLRFSLRGIRSLRVGEFRVLYRIDGTIVRVIMIAHRSKVYR